MCYDPPGREGLGPVRHLHLADSLTPGTTIGPAVKQLRDRRFQLPDRVKLGWPLPALEPALRRETFPTRCLTSLKRTSHLVLSYFACVFYGFFFAPALHYPFVLFGSPTEL